MQVFGDITHGVANAANLEGESYAGSWGVCETLMRKSVQAPLITHRQRAAWHRMLPTGASALKQRKLRMCRVAGEEDGLRQTVLAVKNGKAVLKPQAVSSASEHCANLLRLSRMIESSPFSDLKGQHPQMCI